MEIWDLYNRAGEKTGETHIRGQQVPKDRYHMVIHFWVVNSEGHFLTQQRSNKTESKQGLWANTGGSATTGETSLEAMKREVEEEIGYKIPDDAKLKVLKRFWRDVYFTDVWILEADVPLNEFNPGEEVSQVIYRSQAEIEEMVKQKSFWDFGEEYFGVLFEAYGTVTPKQ